MATSEILSTDIRATGHGAANAVSRLAGIVTPYIINDQTSLVTIGAFVFTISTLTAAATMQLPETAGRAMGAVHHDVAEYDKAESSAVAPYQPM